MWEPVGHHAGEVPLPVLSSLPSHLFSSLFPCLHLPPNSSDMASDHAFRIGDYTRAEKIAPSDHIRNMSHQIAICSEGIGVAGPTHPRGNEKSKTTIADLKEPKDEITVTDSVLIDEDDPGTTDTIIVTGADVAANLIPMRDDHDTAITFRAIFLGSVFVAFSAGLGQIYNVSCIVHQVYHPY